MRLHSASIPPAGNPGTPFSAVEIGWIAAILVAGAALRFLWCLRFPLPIFNDPFTIVALARQIAGKPFAHGSAGWDFLSPGLPVTLAVLFRAFHNVSSDAIARWSTAAFNCSLPLFPFLMWRGIIRLRWRVTASVLLALWPGGVFQSHVAFQDTWVTVPVIALACLSIRELAGERAGMPALAAVLYALSVFYREDMLVVCLPLLVTAAGLWPRSIGRRRRTLRTVLVLAPCLLAMAGLRWAGSGRFSILTSHGGYSMLGSYAPHAPNVFWWEVPYDYLDAFEPEMTRDNKRMFRETAGLAEVEFLVAPRRQLGRMVSGTISSFIDSDQADLTNHVRSTAGLTRSQRLRADDVVRRVRPILEIEMEGVLALLIASAVVGTSRRSLPILATLGAVGLKLAVQAVTVPSSFRYYYPITALALLAITMAAREIDRSSAFRLLAVALTIGIVCAVALRLAAARLAAYAGSHQERVPITLWELPVVESSLRCESSNGVLLDWGNRAVLRFPASDLTPGQEAIAVCQLIGGLPSIFRLIDAPEARGLFLLPKVRPDGSGTRVLELNDPESSSGHPNRVVQSVVIDGREVFRHEIASSPGTGWSRIELPTVIEGQHLRLAIRLTAGNPERGWDWGGRSATEFQLASKDAPNP